MKFPARFAMAGSVMDWSTPASTLGGWFNGTVPVAALATESSQATSITTEVPLMQFSLAFASVNKFAPLVGTVPDIIHAAV
jgi:hypothetical protein